MEGTIVKCAACGSSCIDLRAYTSMMVLSPTQALFVVRCANCNQMVSAVEDIPTVLFPDVFQAAAEVNAGMGAKPNT